MIKFFACKNPDPRPIILYLPAAAAAETGNITWHRKDVYVNLILVDILILTLQGAVTNRAVQEVVAA